MKAFDKIKNVGKVNIDVISNVGLTILQQELVDLSANILKRISQSMEI